MYGMSIIQTPAPMTITALPSFRRKQTVKGHSIDILYMYFRKSKSYCFVNSHHSDNYSTIKCKKWLCRIIHWSCFNMEQLCIANVQSSINICSQNYDIMLCTSDRAHIYTHTDIPEFAEGNLWCQLVYLIGSDHAESQRSGGIYILW